MLDIWPSAAILTSMDKDDMYITEAQMMLYAVKDNRDPDSAECKREYREMRKAVKNHNKGFKS